MKIILSRKGFDSTAGGVPSPILPDGRLLSLPIPDALSPIRYGDIGGTGRDIGRLVSNLTGGRIRRNSRAHLDPDLIAGDRPRHPHWRPVFGQAGAAQGHLRNQGVGPGDLFLFFGLFQATRWRGRRLIFDCTQPARQVIWGWLQIGQVACVDQCSASLRTRLGDHPHFSRPPDPGNTLYVARRCLHAPGIHGQPGAGVHGRLHSRLVLTDPAAERPGRWRLPAWMAPRGGSVPLSYHGRAGRWRRRGRHTLLDAVARGQEFVLDTNEYPEAIEWLAGLIGPDTSADTGGQSGVR